MTLRQERPAIEQFIRDNWTATPLNKIGMDAQSFTATNNSVLFTIKSGIVLQGSIGRVQNVIESYGTVICKIHVEGGKGSDTWRGYGDAIQAMFANKSITTTGAIAGSDVFVRFSPPQLAPNEHSYPGDDYPEPPFYIAIIIAPFVRYNLR